MRGAAIICAMYSDAERRALALELTDAFLSGRWEAEALAERGAGCLDRWPSWLDALAFAAAPLGRGSTAPPYERRAELGTLIERFLRDRAAAADAPAPRIVRLTVRAPAQRGGRRSDVLVRSSHPSARRPRLTLRDGREPAAIDSPLALAQMLELSDGQLAWLADVRGLERRVAAERLRNYRYRWVPRRSGVPRLLEAPKARLKEIQRWIAHEILDAAAPDDGAHGFVRGRSALTHAAAHCSREIVLRLDLRDFFASVAAGRVYGIFDALGYTPKVAYLLCGLCTNATPAFVFERLAPVPPPLIGRIALLRRQLATPHLPQGAPCSPALANLAAVRLDRRLRGLASAFELHYSRYCDDLTFSGARLTRTRFAAFRGLAQRIVRAEGFVLNADKTLLRTRAQRQQVTGIVVNARPNVARIDYDRLRATLHALARGGNAAAAAEPGGGRALTRRAQLYGQVAWVGSLNAARGAKLRRALDAIDWPDGAPTG